MTLWEKDLSDGWIIELKGTGRLEATLPVSKVLFFELQGSGAGDQYYFDGTFDLGFGPRQYQIFVFSLFTEVGVQYWLGKQKYNACQPERETASRLALQLLDTMSPELIEGMRHDLNWLKNAFRRIG